MYMHGIIRKVVLKVFDVIMNDDFVVFMQTFQNNPKYFLHCKTSFLVHIENNKLTIFQVVMKSHQDSSGEIRRISGSFIRQLIMNM